MEVLPLLFRPSARVSKRGVRVEKASQQVWCSVVHEPSGLESFESGGASSRLVNTSLVVATGARRIYDSRMLPPCCTIKYSLLRIRDYRRGTPLGGGNQEDLSSSPARDSKFLRPSNTEEGKIWQKRQRRRVERRGESASG